MKRSVQVAAPLLASAAFSLLTACRSKPEMQRCVDESNHVVADSLCGNQPAGQTAVGNHSGMGFVPVPMYRYYYGGLGGYALGSMVSGGGFNAMSGRSYATSSGRITGSSRGGFGSSFGGGHGGSGGE